MHVEYIFLVNMVLVDMGDDILPSYVVFCFFFVAHLDYCDTTIMGPFGKGIELFSKKSPMIVVQ